MTRLSGQYIPHLALVLLPVMIPVLVHSYGHSRVEECANPSALCQSGVGSAQEPARDRHLREVFQASQWCEGDLAGGLRFSIIRSYDPKRLYHHPELTFIHGMAPDRRTVEWAPDGSESLPIHRVWYETGERGLIAAYILVYDSRPVDNPYLAQFASFPKQLAGGSYPMTLFFISGEARRDDLAAMEKQAREWLLASWEGYRRSCLQHQQ